MQKELKDIIAEIYAKTNGGLDIIFSLFPQANTKKHFKMRDEKTASASLFKGKDGVYLVKDFGSGDKAKNAIHLFCEENGFSFYDGLKILARNYQVAMGGHKEKNEAKFRKIDQTEWKEDIEFNEDGFAFATKDFTEQELKVLGPFVSAEVCQKYGLFSLKFYATKKEGRITIVEPTESFPIFIFCFEEKTKDGANKFYKILQPKSEDKKWRFFWKGKKPSTFIGGLNVLIAEMAKRLAEEAASLQDESTPGVKKAEKIDKVFLCSGERDAINVASMGYFVLWQNSETANLEPAQYKKIMTNAEDLYNIPDLDDTGRKQGHELAMKYLDIKTLWLPNWLLKKKDWRGNPRKDMTDFAELHQYQGAFLFEKEFEKLINQSYPMRFWDVYIDKNGAPKYQFNNVHAFNFLAQNGFYRLNVREDKDGYKFIHVKEHVVREIRGNEVKDFINNFLEKRHISTPIRNMVYNTSRLSETQIANLPKIELDFTDYDKFYQLFFFSHETWRITADGIEAYQENKQKKYVWDEDIIDQRINFEYSHSINPKSIKVEDDYFSCKKGEFNWEIEIHEKNCEFLNFLIQTSRIHWSKELAQGFNNEEEQQAYWDANLFNIAGERLDEDEIIEQKAHLVNKIFVLGYLMHRYKHPNKAWAVYAMENALVDDNESHGGSGKSIILKTPGKLMNWKIIDARNSRMWENNFLFDGVTEHTDYILFDDADRNFRLANLYSSITGPLTVNPKNNKPFTIPFRDAPKYAISSNYSLRETDPSTTRRLLFTALSDYYHQGGDNYDEKRDPTDDFGHALFTDWKDDQWNKLFNFLAQCVKFYLSVGEKINPPMEQVTMRNLQSFMGISFMEWAEEYLADKINQEFPKKEALEDLKKSQPPLKNISSQNFLKRVEAWSKYNGYIFMPEAATDKNGRIQRQDELGHRQDFLLIQGNETGDADELPF